MSEKRNKKFTIIIVIFSVAIFASSLILEMTINKIYGNSFLGDSFLCLVGLDSTQITPFLISLDIVIILFPTVLSLVFLQLCVSNEKWHSIRKIELRKIASWPLLSFSTMIYLMIMLFSFYLISRLGNLLITLINSEFIALGLSIVVAKTESGLLFPSENKLASICVEITDSLYPNDGGVKNTYSYEQQEIAIRLLGDFLSSPSNDPEPYLRKYKPLISNDRIKHILFLVLYELDDTDKDKLILIFPKTYEYCLESLNSETTNEFDIFYWRDDFFLFLEKYFDLVCEKSNYDKFLNNLEGITPSLGDDEKTYNFLNYMLEYHISFPAIVMLKICVSKSYKKLSNPSYLMFVLSILLLTKITNEKDNVEYDLLIETFLSKKPTFGQQNFKDIISNEFINGLREETFNLFFAHSLYFCGQHDYTSVVAGFYFQNEYYITAKSEEYLMELFVFIYISIASCLFSYSTDLLKLQSTEVFKSLRKIYDFKNISSFDYFELEKLLSEVRVIFYRNDIKDEVVKRTAKSLFDAFTKVRTSN